MKHTLSIGLFLILYLHMMGCTDIPEGTDLIDSDNTLIRIPIWRIDDGPIHGVRL